MAYDNGEEVVPSREAGKDKWAECDTFHTEMNREGWETRGCILFSPRLPRVWQGEC